MKRTLLIALLLGCFGFVRSARACDEAVTDYSMTEIDYGSDGSGWDDYGDISIEDTGGTCSCTITDLGASWLLDDGSTVNGTGGLVTAFEANSATKPGTTAPVYNDTVTLTHLVICTVSGHKSSENFIKLTLPVEGEFATTYFEWDGSAGHNCYYNGADEQFCYYDVAFFCTNVPADGEPDFNLDSVPDSQAWFGWEGIGACVRFGASSPWGCANLVDFGMAHTGFPIAPTCTYNP